MIALDATTKKLEVVLNAAKSTNDMEWNIFYYDVPSRAIEDQSEYRLAHSHGVTDGTTTVTLLAAPANGYTRNVVHIAVHNADSATKAIIVKVDINGTERKLVNLSATSGQSIIYEAGSGWQTV